MPMPLGGAKGLNQGATNPAVAGKLKPVHYIIEEEQGRRRAGAL